MDNCIFCKIGKGELPCKFLYEDDEFVAFNSNAPVAETHIIIIPKKHISTFMELDSEILGMTKIAQKLIRDKKLEGAYRLCFNGGKYLEVMHVHLHLLAGKIDSYT
jgi:histidine triad (HIT) family protein